MLSGIRTVKRKRTGDNNNQNHDSKSQDSPSGLSAVEEIKRRLALPVAAPPPPTSGPINVDEHVERLLKARNLHHLMDDSPNPEDTVLVTVSSLPSDLTKQREDFRRGARKGKLKASTEDLHDPSIADMIAEEAATSQNMDDIYALNVSRLGSRYKGTELKLMAGATAGADEDEPIDMKMYTALDKRLTNAAQVQRQCARALKINDTQSQFTAKSWWWLESPKFEKHRLLALGNFVSLICAPPSQWITSDPPPTLYLVPIKFADRLVACDDQVWDEVRRFHSALTRMYAKAYNCSLIMCETVTSNMYQTKLELYPVPQNLAADAPMFFKSALMEVAQEWGTHKLMRITHDKTLRATVPTKNSFLYFYVDWGWNDGYAQIIQDTFSRDFGADTLAGIMGEEPRRMRRRQQRAMNERKYIADWLEDWKEFDWTTQLD